MTPILSDADLLTVGTAWGYPDPATFLPFARALEDRLVVAIRDTRTVTEREKVLACRAAFDAGAAWQMARSTFTVGGQLGTALGKALNGTVAAVVKAPDKDTLYPLPTTKRARTITLSNGLDVSGSFDPGSSEVLWTHGEAKALGDMVFSFARTAKDARDLADLIDTPFEQVPGDAL